MTYVMPPLAARTLELATELAAMRLSGAASNTPDYQELDRRLNEQVENLTVREARLLMEAATVIEERLP